MKGKVQFWAVIKLKPRFIGPFIILDRVGSVSYYLELAPKFEHVYKFFHLSMLRKYLNDPSHVVDF